VGAEEEMSVVVAGGKTEMYENTCIIRAAARGGEDADGDTKDT